MTEPDTERAGKAIIWVDADACPRAVKEILYRASARLGVELVLVANVPLRTPESPLISTLVVPAGVDVADNEIVLRVRPGDLVISADIPLAADVTAKGADCLDPRGTLHTRDTIHARLSMRNLMEELRGSDERVGGGPNVFSQRDRQAFANQLEAWFRRSQL